MATYELTVNYNSNYDAAQHTYESTLDISEFTRLMEQEWLINLAEGDSISVEVLTSK